MLRRLDVLVAYIALEVSVFINAIVLSGNKWGLTAIALIVGVHIRVHVCGGGACATVVTNAVAVFINVLGAFGGATGAGDDGDAESKDKRKYKE